MWGNLFFVAILLINLITTWIYYAPLGVSLMKQLLLLILFLSLSLQAKINLPENTPDKIKCEFKCSATVSYCMNEKKYQKELNKITDFGFSIEGLATGNPVLVCDGINNPLAVIKVEDERVYLYEVVRWGVNIITLYLDSKKVSFTKQYGLSGVDGESPYVYSWVGELIVDEDKD